MVLAADEPISQPLQFGAPAGQRLQLVLQPLAQDRVLTPLERGLHLPGTAAQAPDLAAQAADQSVGGGGDGWWWGVIVSM